ncbi:iron aquisition yersiniabactin synthesis enzyme (YbtT,resembles thioesterases) [Klebsiella pneumoniae]|uniref:Iron aquisition yersiniabactin synthesis enzyme (YbtT,resembles thioesterases) n=1 Tax=Klebsiella pneumoniae TaxID=573 RepID=A0A377YNA9_KLEPN|nr:thioesterase domain-containing protein [Klebsiella pneumoniae]STR74490.1 iron aquisition yersiniabactin synthesis enzyme (YbtT,resembles thioesterases) [Klebsiella pneumoniae]STR89562.1 iron aquisition yersiniabactin synthesis enzyme (YbtT,resembles thioesterases) [Klebsiella pneumoniae]STS37265.1 iron aquisition yersiniabactin synthesis enzyme (YbtT,resembles thioesterases) [Klebsiella pneumoniae]STS43000.1 iron aquisition yersiniabactin synthesis enzyme (YbtT,resembles thioesterases) [Kleb
MTSPWIRTLSGYIKPELQLFCLPHAGGNAGLYRGWREHLPPEIELNVICYPGRLERWQHPIPATMPELVGEVSRAIAPHLGENWAIFGHSMGAVVAHETILALKCDELPPPQLLAVSAREAPQFHQPGLLHQQDDEALCQELLRLDGTDPVLLTLPEMRELILPTMRADYALIEQWQLSSRQLLSCPIAAFMGSEDPELDQMQAEGWASWTTASFTLDCFCGGHFYFREHPQPLLSRLLARLSAIQALS